MGFVKSQPADPSKGEDRKVQRDLAGLTTALCSADPKSRRWAARDLAHFPAAVDALLTQLARETDREVREAIFITLAQFDNSQAVNGLIHCLRSEDAALRNSAIDALKLMPAAVAPMMAQLLRDPSADVRILAINVLESLRHPEVEAWLIGVIAQDTHVNVCATAVDLLTEVGTKTAVQALLALKSRFAEEPFMHFAIDVALQRIQGE